MRARRHAKHFIASVRYADGGTYDYFFNSTARSRRDAEDDARTSAEHAGGTLVELKPIEDGRVAQARRLFAVAGLLVAVWGTTIAAAIVLGVIP